MSNEEILEEIYSTVRQNNVLEKFTEVVNKNLESKNEKTMYEIVNETYYSFIKSGLIVELD